MVQWKITLKGNSYWRYTHFPLNNDYGRKGNAPCKIGGESRRKGNDDSIPSIHSLSETCERLVLYRERNHIPPWVKKNHTQTYLG